MSQRAGAAKTSSTETVEREKNWLVGGGEMGKVVRSMDWSKTPLGPIQSWPQSLRTAVGLCLASNFPISLAWGTSHVQIYNDGYWPICGGKHPSSMGQDYRVCWASAWPAVVEAFERALTGETSYLENQRMFLDRNGYLEEAFFTFSFIPIRDESGVISGLFHPVTENTSHMLSERRTRCLRDLAALAGKAQTLEEACNLAANTLADYELDIPLALFYQLDASHGKARLAACAGLRKGMPASPEEVELAQPQERGWPLKEVASDCQSRHVEDLVKRFGDLSAHPYPESVEEALVFPIIPPGCVQPVVILVAGVSPRSPLTESYRAFYDLLAVGVTTAVANARSHEAERQRAEALAEIDRAKTAFFSNVSHEFRTPLTLMLGPLEEELAEQSDPLPEARRKRLETAYLNSRRLLNLVNTLLDFSRIEAGRVQASFEPTDLAMYTADLTSMFRSAVEKAGLTLTIDCPSLPEPVYVDREMWEKIVLNLLSNALKHTFEGGVAVQLSWCGNGVELSVADSGVGIPEASLPRLFERFHQIKGTKSRSYLGTGIGLALVHELISLHGGAIRAESVENEGSKFTVTMKRGKEHLPPERVYMKREPASISARAETYIEEPLQWLPNSSKPSDRLQRFRGPGFVSAQDQNQTFAGAAFPRPTILWADDNADMGDYVRRLLADRYDVIAVADGSTALAIALEEPPELVLSDVMMPGLDGFGLLRELRKNEVTRSIPVILLSARAGEEAALEGLNAGADDYLTKPFSAKELRARVRTHLELSRIRRKCAKEIEKANQELEAFADSVSHYLRTPLAVITGYCSLLRDNPGSSLDLKSFRQIMKIDETAGRMAVLIDNLLEFSHSSHAALNWSNVNLVKMAASIIGDFELELSRRNVEWKLASLPIVLGDEAMLRQVLVNLLSNALKYTRHRTCAVIEIGYTLAQNDLVHIFVRDNGVGFDPLRAGRLFVPFQRLHRAEEFEGTGIGLANVRRIIARHNGKTWAESKPGEGATFYFSLPREKSKLAKAAR